MKVPLSEEFSDDKLCQTPVPADHIHTPKEFLKKQADEYSRKVGLVVDLTFTHKYYDGKKEFEAEGVEYLKILTAGGGTEPPKKPDLEIFAKKVTDFFKRRPEEFCAVHCTHGINRSGFFIVNFLVEQCKMGLKEALACENLDSSIYVCVYLHVFMYACMHLCMCKHVYIYTTVEHTSISPPTYTDTQTHQLDILTTPLDKNTHSTQLFLRNRSHYAKKR